MNSLNRTIAQPIALELAAISKRLFIELRVLMAEKSDSSAIENAKLKYEIQMLRIRRGIEAKEALLETEAKIKQALLELKSDLFDAERSRLNNSQKLPPPTITPEISSPNLSKVIDTFLANYLKGKYPEMFKKHKTVLPVFLECVGDKPVCQLKQADLNSFFKTIQALPPRWADQCRSEKISVKVLAGRKHPKTLGPMTLEGTYVASIRAFLLAAKSDWQDQGFPTTLTTDNVTYQGTREPGENKQRSFTKSELVLLFNNDLMVQFRNDKVNSSKFWLPFIGLYTGVLNCI